MNFKLILMGKHAVPEKVGAKAWNLYRIQDRIAVPDFVVLSTEAYRVYARYGKIPEGMKKEMRHILQERFYNQPIAVRSSGTAEDLADASFAGMYETVLNVTGVDMVIDAVRKVWDSNHSARVVSYRARHHLVPGGMAVILQRMLTPDVSGIMVTGGSEQQEGAIIECCRGLADKLVSGEISPTRYRCKKKEIIHSAGDDLLSRKHLRELVAAGQAIQDIFYIPQDIEWAYQDGRLYILQARPLTASVKVSAQKNTVWCSANLRETIPDPISPMGYSFFEEVWLPDIIINIFGFPMTREQYKQYPPVERVLGRMYWNINNSAAYGRSIDPILKFMKGGAAVDPQFQAAMESIDLAHVPQLVPASTMIRFTINAIVRMTFFLFKTYWRFRSAARAIEQAFLEINQHVQEITPTHDLQTGIHNVRQWVQAISDPVAKRYFGGLLISIFYLALLVKIMGWSMGRKGEAVARMTVYGLIDKTGEMVIAMENLAATARRKIDRLSEKTLSGLYRRDREFRRQFDAFLEEFGHRGPAEFDAASINWREDPNRVWNIIKNMSPGISVEPRERYIHRLLQNLPACPKFFVKRFLPRLEYLVPIRENGKHYLFKILGRIKEQLSILEQIMQRRGWIKHERDIYFLSLRDLEAIQKGSLQGSDVAKVIARNKREWHEYRACEAPPVVFEDGRSTDTIALTRQGFGGTPISYGRVQGRARIIGNYKESHNLKSGEIMITHHTDPGWTPLFSIAGGVVIEVGGLICHAAMVARELGVPAIVLPGATSSIPDGSWIELDADLGTVRIVRQKAERGHRGLERAERGLYRAQ